MSSRISQGQLERAVGGPAELVKFVDKQGAGDIQDSTCQAYLSDVMEEANAEVDGYVSLAVDLASPELRTAPLLVRYELDIAVYLLWYKSTGGHAIPEKVDASYRRAIEELEKIGRREKGLGLPSRQTTSQPVQQVTKDDDESYFSESSPRARFNGWS